MPVTTCQGFVSNESEQLANQLLAGKAMHYPQLESTTCVSAGIIVRGAVVELVRCVQL